MEIIAPLALLGAIVTGIAAAFMFWTSQTASRAGRGALFNTERQVAIDRARRARLASVSLFGMAALLLGVNVLTSGSGSVSITPATATPTRTPRPSPTLAPATREAMIATVMPTPTPPPAPQTAVVTDAGEPGLRLRAEPNGAEIDFLRDGTVLELLPEAQVTTPDGLTWQKVRDPQGREGWVATAYIRIQ